MDVEYTGSVRDDISRILGGVEELEELIRQQCSRQPVSRVTIAPLIPGRSGAVVFLVRRLDSRGPRKPWVVKASSDLRQVNQERRNYHTYIQDRWPQVPALLDTGASRLLIYEFGGFLAGFEPTTLRQGYRQSSPEALSVLMQRLVKVLFSVHQFSTDTLPLLQRQPLDPPPHEHLPTLDTLTPALAAEVSNRWQDAMAQAAKPKHPSRISTGCHSDPNAGNILFEPGDQDSYPLFIDFGVMEEGASLGYPSNGYPPFWDYAKLERDIKTRLFVEEATGVGLDLEAMVSVIRHLDPPEPDGPMPSELAALPCVQRLTATLQALREAVRRSSPPELFEGCYRLSVAYSTLRVLYRPADEDLDPIAQHRLAAESVLALLQP
ncbi:MAG: phosphotransferase, partial [Cyanobium sp.]